MWDALPARPHCREAACPTASKMSLRSLEHAACLPHLTVGCGERQVKQLEAQLGSSSPRTQASQGAVRTHPYAYGTPCRPWCAGQWLLTVRAVAMLQLM